MRKLAFAAALAALTALLVTAAPAFAASPHFVGTPTASRDGDTLTVDFKVAGLGNDDVTATLTADAQCFNRGGQAPRAENKGAVLATGTFSPKNGQLTASLSGAAQTDPACNPPMELRYANVIVTVDGLTATLPGTF
jgi:hypothetical protein